MNEALAKKRTKKNEDGQKESDVLDDVAIEAVVLDPHVVDGSRLRAARALQLDRAL
jgi:hypothetical protein